MYLSWGMLFSLLAGIGIAWFWHDSLGVRERANLAAMEACRELQLQFLDGTVAFARLWPARGPGGRLTLRRTYVFDYTADSIARRQGFVVLLGARVETVGFASDAPGRPTAAMQSEPRKDAPPAWGNVYDLNSWRNAPHRLKDPRQDSGNDSST